MSPNVIQDIIPSMLSNMKLLQSTTNQTCLLSTTLTVRSVILPVWIVMESSIINVLLVL